MTVRVRLFAERDYVAFARIRSTGEADPTSPELARERDARWDSSRYEKVRAMAVDEEDAPLGYVEIRHEPSRFAPKGYFVRLVVDLRARRRGIGEALWRHARAELDERRAATAWAWARHATAGETFLAKRGFREVIHWYSQVRAVATAPLATISQQERLAAAGVRIATLAELARDDAGALAKAHDLYFASRPDQVTLGPVTPVPFEHWRAETLGDPALLESYLIAIADRRYVGQTVARPSDDVLAITATGVLPAYRRRGVARALKLRLHAYAREKGYREIHTRNARENTAIVALNDGLGYVIVESSTGYELALPGPSA